MNYINKEEYDEVLNKYYNEYLEFGKKLGLFKNNDEIAEFESRFLNLRVEYKETYFATAKLERDENSKIIKLIINPNKVFNKSEERLSDILFHEFTHLNSRLEDSLYCYNNELLKQFTSTFVDTVRYMFDENYYNVDIEKANEDSHYFFSSWGFVLLDEAIAQNVAERMLDLKYNRKRKREYFECSYAPISCYSTFLSYRIFEELADKFAKTLRGINGLDDLCVKAFSDDFANNLIADHIDNVYVYESLYKELSYMGVIALAEYVNDGFQEVNGYTSLLDKNKIATFYNLALEILDNNFDNRNAPDNYVEISFNGDYLFW